jgi:tRNA(Ile)-lysidine synthase
MVLLQVLESLAATNGWKMVVAHFNHRLRGRASEADEKLVRQTAKKMRLKFIGESADVKAFAMRSKLSIEMAARKLRHEFLARAAAKEKIKTIALAHHADDQVELFFLRLLRGSGGEGLAGMKWRSPSPMDKRITLIRPLLDRTKEELAEFARAAGITFRTDATNLTRTMPRNRVRNELLPLLRAHYQPGLTKTVLRVMEIAGAESDLAGELASDWLAQAGLSGADGARDLSARGGGGLPPAPMFAGLPVAVQRRVVQMQLLALGLPVDFDLVEQLRLTPGRPVSVGLELQVVRDPVGTVTLRTTAAAEYNAEALKVSLSARNGTVTFADTTIAWERLAAGKWTRPVPQPGREMFDADRVGTAVGLRHWRAGDRFQPLGMKTPVKLQNLFTNARIPRDQRRGLVVAVARGEIFWVEGLRMAERFKLSATTKARLVWRWRRRPAGKNSTQRRKGAETQRG